MHAGDDAGNHANIDYAGERDRASGQVGVTYKEISFASFEETFAQISDRDCTERFPFSRREVLWLVPVVA